MMPNCYALTRRSEPEAGYVKLAQVDDEMRVALGAPPSTTEWYAHWGDLLGVMFAIGKTPDQIRETVMPDTPLRAALDWIDANFTVDAWARIGR